MCWLQRKRFSGTHLSERIKTRVKALKGTWLIKSSPRRKQGSECTLMKKVSGTYKVAIKVPGTFVIRCTSKIKRPSSRVRTRLEFNELSNRG